VSDPQAFYDITSKQDESVALLETVAKFSNGFLNAIKEQSKKVGGNQSLITSTYEGEEAISIGLSNVSQMVLGDDFDSSSESESVRKAHAEFGTSIHKLIDYLYSPKSSNKHKPNISGKYKNLDNNKVEKVIKTAVEQIKTLHTGENKRPPKIITEFSIVSKSASPNLIDQIAKSDLQLSYLIGDKEHLKRVNGRIDLIVIDDDGDVWVYDFKNSENPLILGSRKNEKNELNLASYMAMLRQ